MKLMDHVSKVSERLILFCSTWISIFEIL